MAVTPNSAITVQTPNIGNATFTANPGTYKTIYTGGTNGSKIMGIIATNTDSSTAHLVTVQIYISSVAYWSTAVNVPSTAGTANGIPPVNLLSSGNAPGFPIDQWGNPFFYLASGNILQATYTTALSNGAVNVIVVAADF